MLSRVSHPHEGSAIGSSSRATKSPRAMEILRTIKSLNTITRDSYRQGTNGILCTNSRHTTEPSSISWKADFKDLSLLVRGIAARGVRLAENSI